MKRLHFFAGVGIVALTTLTSCIDDKYNLSDIDTTTQLRIDNLTVPIKIDQVFLEDVLTLDDESNFKLITFNGEDIYAMIKSGSIESDPIDFDHIVAPSPKIDPSVCSIKGVPISGQNKGVTFDLMNIPGVKFEFNFEDVDESICGVEKITTEPIYFDITLKPDFKALNGAQSEITFDGLEFRLPKGMDATCNQGTYKSEDGTLTVDQITTVNEPVTIRTTAKSIDIEENGMVLNEKTHSFKYNGVLEVLGGVMTVYTNSSSVTLANLNFTLDYKISEIKATGLTGTIKYDMEGVEIDPVTLEDIPDFLTQEDTNIFLTNPQVYLNFNNPVSKWKLECQTGLEVRSIRESGVSKTYTLDNGTITVPKIGNGPYNFVLSPIEPEHPRPSFEKDLKWEKFSGLSEVIGNGPMPESIEIKLDHPCIPRQHVDNIELGKGLPSVKGEWELFAPLNLKAGSQIIYEATEDNWDFEDLEDLIVDKMEVTALVYSDFPCSLQMTADPIDSNGNVIKNVELVSTAIPANANGSELVMTLKGSFRDLNGIRYRAVAKTDKDTGDWTPDMKIKLDKIRVTVSGNWIKKF